MVTRTTDFDVVLVGSGINSLVCAALAARRGFRVCILERNPVLGGCIRTDELTLPGYRHDTLSGFHPLFVTSPAFAILQQELLEAGLEYCNNGTPTGVVMPDGRHAILRTSREENETSFDALCAGDGQSFRAQMQACEAASALTFGVLGGEPWSLATLRLLAVEAWRRSPRALAGWTGESLQSSRHWLEAHFAGDVLKAMLAPWVLHTGLGPDSAMAGFMTRLIAFTLEAAGMPVVKGGSAHLVRSFKQVIERRGGVLRENTEVVRVLTERGRACGVVLHTGERVRAKRAVVCNVTPTQLYGSLLDESLISETVRRAARAYRYGRGDMQIHLALSEPLRWRRAELGGVVLLHISAGIDAVATAVAQAEGGLLPSDPTLVVGQPTAVDPSRAPPGAAIVWLQLQELPSRVRGDARGLIPVPEDGNWTETLKEAYADRALEALRAHVENLDEALLARKTLSPADLESLNVNLVGGDPYSGACSIDQSLFWRPLPGMVRHETPVRGLFHIGASTHPGPGLGGVSGYLVAEAL